MDRIDFRHGRPTGCCNQSQPRRLQVGDGEHGGYQVPLPAKFSLPPACVSDSLILRTECDEGFPMTTRREVLRIGTAALGLSLTSLLRADSKRRKARSVVILYL